MAFHLRRKETSRGWLVVRSLLAAVVIVACFFYAIPKFASFSEVWTEIETITPFEIGILLVARALNLVTCWWQNMVSIPGLGLWQAAETNQTATTVANTLPITPGGVGVVEVAYIGGIILAGRGHTSVPAEVFHAQVTAGVLVFRALTYGIQIPIGGVTYVIWKAKKRWRQPTPVPVPVPVAVPVP